LGRIIGSRNRNKGRMPDSTGGLVHVGADELLNVLQYRAGKRIWLEV
jgi:hypothetical protein